MTDPAEQAAPQPELEIDDVHSGDQFEVRLPIATAAAGDPATHVARMRGDEKEFTDALTAFVETGSEASDPLRMPIGSSSVGVVADLLDGLGGASVVSIDPV